MFKITLLRFFFILFISSYIPVNADKIRDLTSIQGVRENQLIGYGLVVGLDGTGDQSMQSPYTRQSLNNMLSHFGISIPLNATINLKNVAAVVVTAQLPPFSHTGEKLDIVVSSIGNSHSLKGGTLLMTPLKGADNQIYAIAQGNILVSENTDAEKKRRFFYSSIVNSGRINNGAIIEKEIHNNFGKNNTVNLQLNEENFSLAQRISDVINVQYQDTAIPIDSKTIKLNIPANNGVQVHMLSNIQDINIVMPIQEARVIMNARTGSVVINKEVQLGSCAISHKNLSVVINNEIPLYFLNNLNINTKKDLSDVIKKTITQSNIFNHEKLNNIIKALRALGAKPEELTSILQLMKNAGCLHAKLEII